MLKTIVILLFVLVGSASSQEWMENLTPEQRGNYYEIQNSFNQYWEGKDVSQKGQGYKQFKRWEWFWESRILKDGTFPEPGRYFKEVQKLKKAKNKGTKLQGFLEWNFVGPQESTGGYAGLGRVNLVRTQPNSGGAILFACAANGGLWKSTDAGVTWNSNTDDLVSLGIQDIVIDPNNTNTMYIATGDRDGSYTGSPRTYSAGVLKTLDGGVNWNETGLSYISRQRIIITRLLMDPNDADILYASTTRGIYKTTDGGENWTKKNSTHQKDMEFNPDNSAIIYASNKIIIKSTNSGDTWDTLSTGLPTDDIGRIAIAITGDEPDRVFAIITKGNGSSLGVYRSDDAGETWVEKSGTSPNMLGSAADGTSAGGQGWYDLAIAVDDLNANNIFVGGVNTWKSTDGGDNWEISTFWHEGTNFETIHADQHDYWFEPGSSRMYISNDGGVYRTSNNGGDYDWIGSGLKITQFYKVAISWNDENFLLAGAQDNGTKKLDGGEWKDYSGGDGMEPMIDYSDDNVIYSSYQSGNFFKSTDRGQSYSSMTITGGTESGAWITPIALDYDKTYIIYVGKDNMWKSTDSGVSFSKQTVAANSKIVHIAVAQSNTDVVYFTTNSEFWRTDDGGANWTKMSRPGTGNISYISIDPSNANKIFATNSGWSSGKKIFVTEDGGDTWANFSGALPNVPTHCVFYEGGPQEKIYVGNDLGVYYTDNTKANWELFSDGLPNVIVAELEMNPTTKRLFAATYGRGVWYFDTDLTVTSPTLLAPADESKALDIGTVVFDWTYSPEAEKYHIQVARDDSFSDIIFDDASLTESTTVMSGLEYYKDYFWRVKGTIGAYSSTWSEVWTFQTNIKTPTLISPEHQSTEIVNDPLLDWASVEGSSTYMLEVSLEPDFDPIFFESATENDLLKLSNLPYLSDIYWRVKAGNENGNTGWSSEFMFTTTIGTPILTLPSNVSSGIDIVYNFGWKEVSGIIDYVFEISTDPNFDEILSSIVGITQNSVKVSAMAYSQKYYWRVKARTTGLESDWSTVFNFTTKVEAPVLISPEDNAFAQDKDLVLLEWDAPNYSNSFTVEMSNLEDFSTTLSKNIVEESQIEFNGGEYGTEYFWRVNLTSDIGASDWSSIFSFTIELESPILTNPANKSTNRALSGNLTWEEITGANQYLVQIANDAEFSANMNQYVANSNSYNYNNLENNNIYYWRVKSVSGENSSAWSEVWYFTSPVDKPLLISPTDDSQTELTDIDFSWASISSASFYDFQLAKDDSFSEIVKSNENRVENTVLAESLNIGEYFWRVRAFAKGDYTDWSKVWSFTINKPKDLPTVPILLSPQDQSDGIPLSSTITWQVVDNANGYDVQISPDNNFDNAQTIILDGKNNTSYTFTDFKYSKNYRWRVRSFNSDGTSDWADEWTFNTVFDTYIISQTESEIPFTLYPNPNSGEFFIKMKENTNEKISINLTGINGEKYPEIFSGIITGNDLKIKLDVNSGNYLLNVNIGEKHYSLKIAVIK